MKKHYLFIIALIAFCTLTGCGSARQVSPPSTISSTLTSLNTKEYDSIYIYKDKLTDRTKDTIYVTDVSIEYRYKMLRDTIYKTQVDSIPYQVTVTEVKEITRPLTWFDHLTRACFWLLLGAVGLYLIRFILKFRKL